MYKLINGILTAAPQYLERDGIITANPTIEELTSLGYKALERAQMPEYNTDTQYLEAAYTEGENITQAWVIKNIADSPERREQKIMQLKSALSETDYKIIKCYEYQLAGLELPYDIATLHAQRQEIRDKINELEGM